MRREVAERAWLSSSSAASGVYKRRAERGTGTETWVRRRRKPLLPGASRKKKLLLGCLGATVRL